MNAVMGDECDEEWAEIEQFIKGRPAGLLVDPVWGDECEDADAPRDACGIARSSNNNHTIYTKGCIYLITEISFARSSESGAVLRNRLEWRVDIYPRGGPAEQAAYIERRIKTGYSFDIANGDLLNWIKAELDALKPPSLEVQPNA